MKKTLLSFVFVFAATALVFGAVVPAEAANGNAWGQKKDTWGEGPGNSAWGRSHNSNSVFGGSVLWGGQNFDNLEALIERLRAMLELMRERQNGAENPWRTNADVEVTTEDATNIEDTSATLHAEVELVESESADVYFEYWTRSGGKLKVERTDVEEVDGDEGDTIDVSIDVSELRENALYHFRAVARDEDGRRDYGVKLTFTTGEDASNDDDDGDEEEDKQQPEANTEDAEDIASTSADLVGSVNMHDFNNGVVFFVYGTDESAIEDAADDFTSYDDVDEDGDNLQKVLVDSNLDDEDDYLTMVEDLDEDTEYFFAIAVAYEDEDGDDVIELGTVKSFVTD